jgi:hypothetical protein
MIDPPERHTNVDLLRGPELEEVRQLLSALDERLRSKPFYMYQKSLIELFRGIVLTDQARRRSRRDDEAGAASFDIFRAWPIEAIEDMWTDLSTLHDQLKDERPFEAKFFAKPLPDLSAERARRWNRQ